jgi:hypothetical protein
MEGILVTIGKRIQIQAVLMPHLLPGQIVHIESAMFKGFATIESVPFEGANFGDVWAAQMEWAVK